MAVLAEVAPTLTAAPGQVRPRLPLQRAEPAVHAATEALRPVAASRDNVVPLVPAVRAEVEQEGEPDEDWSSSLDLVRQVAARTRQQQQEARSLVQRSQELAKYCVTQASATAKAAEERAEAAEARVRLLAQQLQETKARLQGTELQLQQAEARADELRLWLKRLHDSIDVEFHSLTVS